MIEHSRRHSNAGYKLPVRWIGVRDTFASHKENTVSTLLNPLWQGTWTLKEDKHLAIYSERDGIEMVHLHLTGVEDQQAVDRMRTETTGVWFEEPAPSAVLVQSSGLNVKAWIMAITSQRIDTCNYPAILTSNYPDEDHWIWTRFVIHPVKGSCYFRIPPGERASQEQREAWATALQDYPDMLQRLLAGEPGSIIMGPQVAFGFRRKVHTTTKYLEVHEREPVIIGWDFGHTPTCVIGQEFNGYVRIYAAFTGINMGTKQFIERYVQPWLGKFAHFAIDNDVYLMHGYDPSGVKGSEGDITDSAVGYIRDMLGGHLIAGYVDWARRRDPMMATLSRMNMGEASFTIAAHPDQYDDTIGLIKTLEGRWHYPQDKAGNVARDQPKKPNHPWEDYGDALCYMLGRLGLATRTKHRPKVPVLPPVDEMGY